EVGNRRRAVVAVGTLERLELAQVLAERRQHDGLLVYGCAASWTKRTSQIGGSRAMWGYRASRGVAQTRIVPTPISRRMRSASAFWPPGRAARACVCAVTASARARFTAWTVGAARTAPLTVGEGDVVAGSG